MKIYVLVCQADSYYGYFESTMLKVFKSIEVLQTFAKKEFEVSITQWHKPDWKFGSEYMILETDIINNSVFYEIWELSVDE